VLTGWILFWIVKTAAISLFDFLACGFLLGTFIDEDILGFLRNFLHFMIVYAIANAVAKELVELSDHDSLSSDLDILNTINESWDFVQGEILSPLGIIIADTSEERIFGKATERENWKSTGDGCRSLRSDREEAEDVPEERASWIENGDAREALDATQLRIDSRMPISLFDDVSVVLDVSEVSVDYVNRYTSLRRVVLGWVAVVFYTAVLGYDKGLVIK
jgi:hypothetical protein